MIEPRILKGFRDYSSMIMIPKKEIINGLEKVFERFGFVPIDTPALEYTEILLGKGGGETDKQIYRFTDDGGRDIALRYDLTVPLARFVSEHYSELVFPFKRYHIAPVWRGEKPQKGRFREFYQCDFDILGSNSVNADLEILLVIKYGLDLIGAGNFTININNRKIVNAVLKKFNLENKSPELLRTIDKIYKIGYDNVVKELIEIGFDKGIVESILKMLSFTNYEKISITGDEIFKALERIKSELPAESHNSVDHLINIFIILKDMGVLGNFAFNPAITRGLDYYTGVVFETFIDDRLNFGSVCSGGRYDNLTGLYSKNVVSGVGASFGLDRLLSLLEDKNLLEKKATKTDVIVFNLTDNYTSKYYTLIKELQKADINCEFIFEKNKIGNQFKYAERKSVKYVLIAGEEEFSLGKFNLKNIVTGEEKKALSVDEIAKIIKG